MTKELERVSIIEIPDDEWTHIAVCEIRCQLFPHNTEIDELTQKTSLSIFLFDW